MKLKKKKKHPEKIWKCKSDNNDAKARRKKYK